MSEHVACRGSRRVAQSYFDELVEENMQLFEASRQDAIKDTIAELQAQGVDTCNLDTSGDVELARQREETAAIAEQVQSAQDPGSLERLVALLSSAHNRETFYSAGGVVKLFNVLCDGQPSEAVLEPSLRALLLMLKHHDNSKNALTAQRARAVVQKAADCEAIRVSCLGLGLLRSACLRNEANKATVFAAGGGRLTLMMLEQQEKTVLVKEAALLLRAICMADDFRAKISGAHDRTKDLNKLGAAELLVKRCREFREVSDPQASGDEGEGSEVAVLPALFACVKQLCTNVETVKTTVESGMIDEVLGALKARRADVSLCRSGLGVFRNIAADDDVKHRIMTTDCVLLMLAAMDAHLGDALVQEHGLGTFAAGCLRRPDHSEALVHAGGVPSMLNAMRRHPDAVNLQRQGCLALRNMAARGSPLLREQILDEGAEEVLRHAGRFQASVDEAYAALRDLGLDVGIVTVDAGTGNVVEDGLVFGAKKANFNPVHDESSGTNAAIQMAAHSPADDMGF